MIMSKASKREEKKRIRERMQDAWNRDHKGPMRSRRARKRARARLTAGLARHFGYVDPNGKFHRTLTIRPGDNLTDELVHNAVRKTAEGPKPSAGTIH
jgi:hypothetical protein